MVTRCPECDGKVRVEVEDAVVACPHCDAEIRPNAKKMTKPDEAIKAAGSPPPAAHASCPFCGKRFKTSKSGGMRVKCPGCQCKFALPVSNDTAPANEGSKPNNTPRRDPLRDAFMDDIDRQLDDQQKWREWNENERRREIFRRKNDYHWLNHFGIVGWLIRWTFRI